MARQSTIIIAPAGDVQATNDALEVAGWGPGNLSVPLSPDAADPVTHYGCRARAETEDIPVLPVTAMVEQQEQLLGHWDAALQQLGLQWVEPPAEAVVTL